MLPVADASPEPTDPAPSDADTPAPPSARATPPAANVNNTPPDNDNTTLRTNRRPTWGTSVVETISCMLLTLRSLKETCAHHTSQPAHRSDITPDDSRPVDKRRDPAGPSRREQ